MKPKMQKSHMYIIAVNVGRVKLKFEPAQWLLLNSKKVLFIASQTLVQFLSDLSGLTLKKQVWSCCLNLTCLRDSGAGSITFSTDLSSKTKLHQLQ